MTEGTFALVPLEVVLDRRLTLEQTRVLIALFSFRNKVTDTVWPKRASIAERTGLHPSNISAATTALERLGWLQKVGGGGFSKASRYSLCCPVLASQTVADSARGVVADSATVTVADSATVTVADSATRTEQTIEQTNEQTRESAQARPSASVPARAPAPDCPSDVDPQVWADWLQLRRSRRAAVTPTVIDGARREAAKAGLPLTEFLREWCLRGSQGLKAEWLAGRAAGRAAGPALKSFAQQERELGWARWEAMTGRVHPDRIAHEQDAGRVVDVPAHAVACPVAHTVACLEVAP